jgi:hypothetical protein
MQTWAELRADLLSLGYIELTHLEIECDKHGAWRIGIVADAEFCPRCPKCDQPCDHAALGRGLSRQTVAWKCVSPALRDSHKAHIDDPAVVVRCRLNTRRRRPEFLARAQRELQEVLPKLTTRIREPEPAPQTPARNHRATSEEMRRRIVLLAELLLRRESPEVISKTLGIEWKHLKVTICRRQEEIRSVTRTLQGSDRTPSSEIRAAPQIAAKSMHA